MKRSVSRAEMRELDRRATEEFGVPGVVLMENAGRGTAALLLSLGVRGPVIVACGKGNNGGDGFVLARHLDNHGCDVRVKLFADPRELQGDARINYGILEKTRPAPALTAHHDEAINHSALLDEFAAADWIVDALLGTGLRGPASPPLDGVIELINQSGRKVLAVDVPSGLDCDTGAPLGPTVRATHTATFVAWKEGFLRPEATHWTGKVHIVDIGAPRVLVEEILNRDPQG